MYRRRKIAGSNTETVETQNCEKRSMERILQRYHIPPELQKVPEIRSMVTELMNQSNEGNQLPEAQSTLRQLTQSHQRIISQYDNRLDNLDDQVVNIQRLGNGFVAIMKNLNDLMKENISRCERFDDLIGRLENAAGADVPARNGTDGIRSRMADCLRWFDGAASDSGKKQKADAPSNYRAPELHTDTAVSDSSTSTPVQRIMQQVVHVDREEEVYATSPEPVPSDVSEASKETDTVSETLKNYNAQKARKRRLPRAQNREKAASRGIEPVQNGSEKNDSEILAEVTFPEPQTNTDYIKRWEDMAFDDDLFESEACQSFFAKIGDVTGRAVGIDDLPGACWLFFNHPDLDIEEHDRESLIDLLEHGEEECTEAQLELVVRARQRRNQGNRQNTAEMQHQETSVKNKQTFATVLEQELLNVSGQNQASKSGKRKSSASNYPTGRKIDERLKVPFPKRLHSAQEYNDPENGWIELYPWSKVQTNLNWCRLHKEDDDMLSWLTYATQDLLKQTMCEPKLCPNHIKEWFDVRHASYRLMMDLQKVTGDYVAQENICQLYPWFWSALQQFLQLWDCSLTDSHKQNDIYIYLATRCSERAAIWVSRPPKGNKQRGHSILSAQPTKKRRVSERVRKQDERLNESNTIEDEAGYQD